MLLPAILLPSDSDDRRSAERQPINQPSTLRDHEARATDVYVRELSETGFSVATDARLEIGSTVTIGLPGRGRASARVVRQVSGGYGCEFVEALGRAEVMQTFRGGTVIQLTASAPFTPALPEPEIARFPGAVRLGVIVGGSALLWAGIIKAIASLL
ncbi:PilZ domain-containing protein [uncultured Sphingomonas sp.]|uniref:PilZ domain-containing protein n=1 Tax=uncultured Sphingomonas sp. TaxID=158754 RepID=UPI0025CBCDB7|nr:PilZ domain-containing protein [uncultured Sphingomonas sp.]